MSLQILLNSIPIDVTEIIIVITKDYKLFQKLKDIVFKFRQLSRILRINDKLTEVIIRGESYITKLNNKEHREYDKSCGTIYGEEWCWMKLGKYNRDNDLPSVCEYSGCRFWYKYGLFHRENDLPRKINNEGDQSWMIKGKYFRENDLPVEINRFGCRYIEYWKTMYNLLGGYDRVSYLKTKFIFDFLE